MEKIINTTLIALLIVGFVFALWVSNTKTEIAEGSVAYGNEYRATTTNSMTTDVTRVLKNGPASLGSVVITGAAAGTLTFYNATTTNPTLRSPLYSSSSILLADFPNSVAAGTYTFDADAPIGLVVVFSGIEPTSTITYR